MNNLIGRKVKGGGIIIGVVDSYLVQRQQRLYHTLEQREHWDKVWGDWKNKLVAYVYFDNPVKPLTLLEFQATCPYIKEEYLESEYEKVRPESCISIPVDKLDLEPVNRVFSEN